MDLPPFKSALYLVMVLIYEYRGNKLIPPTNFPRRSIVELKMGNLVRSWERIWGRALVDEYSFVPRPSKPTGCTHTPPECRVMLPWREGEPACASADQAAWPTYYCEGRMFGRRSRDS